MACPPSFAALSTPDAGPGARSLSTRAGAVLKAPDRSSANTSAGHSLPQNGSGAQEPSQAAGGTYLVIHIPPLTYCPCLCNSDLTRTVTADELQRLLARMAVPLLSCWPLSVYGRCIAIPFSTGASFLNGGKHHPCMSHLVMFAGPVPDALLSAIVSMAAMDHPHLPGALPQPLPSNASGPDPTQVCLQPASCSSAFGCILGPSSEATQAHQARRLPLPLSVSLIQSHGLTGLRIVGASMSYSMNFE